jgi:CHAD domain-containing protein
VLHDFLSERLPAGASLRPLFLLHQKRQKRLVSTRANAGGAVVAELSVDEVQVYEVDSFPQTDDWSVALEAMAPLASFWTVEAELLEGQDEAQLGTIVNKLEHKRGLQPMPYSKFERALQSIHHHLQVEHEMIEHWTPTLSMADACRLVWRQQLAELLLNEAGVRYSDEIEYVHDMRVAVRRMRTALRLFAPYFRGKRLDRFGQALHTLGQRLGALRDHDVALARLEESAVRASGQPDTYKGIERDWQRSRNKLFRDLLDWLDSESYREFLVEFAAFCAQAGKGARKFKVKTGALPVPHQVRHVVPAMLIKRYTRIRAFEPLFATGELLPAATLHQLRLQCKRFRYTLEFAQPLLGTAGEQLILALKALQDQLGALNDAAVSQRLLSEVEVEQAEAAAAYQTSQQALIDQQSAEVAAAFAHITGPQTRRLVTRAAACV